MGYDKIALCFLVTRDIRNHKVWEEWWHCYKDDINLYFHYSKKSESKVKLDYMIDNRVRPVPTKWGDISLVKAERELYKKAYADKDNKFFILISETCIPVRSFTYTYNKLMKDKTRGMVPYRRIGRYDLEDAEDDELFVPFVNSDICINKRKLHDLIGYELYESDKWKENMIFCKSTII